MLIGLGGNEETGRPGNNDFAMQLRDIVEGLCVGLVVQEHRNIALIRTSLRANHIRVRPLHREFSKLMSKTYRTTYNKQTWVGRN